MEYVEGILHVLGWIAFGLVVIVAIALNALGLFGNWLILGAVAAVWILTGFEHFGLITLGILLALAIVGEVLEAVAASYGATVFGGSKKAFLYIVAGCILGAIAGTPWLPIVGSLIGALIGGFAAATLYEYIVEERHVRESVWAGIGAALGKAGGIFAKLFVGFVMLAVTAFSYFY